MLHTWRSLQTLIMVPSLFRLVYPLRSNFLPYTWWYTKFVTPRFLRIEHAYLSVLYSLGGAGSYWSCYLHPNADNNNIAKTRWERRYACRLFGYICWLRNCSSTSVVAAREIGPISIIFVEYSNSNYNYTMCDVVTSFVSILKANTLSAIQCWYFYPKSRW